MSIALPAKERVIALTEAVLVNSKHHVYYNHMQLYNIHVDRTPRAL